MFRSRCRFFDRPTMGVRKSEFWRFRIQISEFRIQNSKFKIQNSKYFDSGATPATHRTQIPACFRSHTCTRGQCHRHVIHPRPARNQLLDRWPRGRDCSLQGVRSTNLNAPKKFERSNTFGVRNRRRRHNASEICIGRDWNFIILNTCLVSTPVT